MIQIETIAKKMTIAVVGIMARKVVASKILKKEL